MYEKCITCDKLGKECIPNLYVMDVSEIRDWARALKAHKGISNAELANLSGVPKGTIDSNFSSHSGRHPDVNYSTFAPILRALIGCTGDEMPCKEGSYESSEIISRIESENEFLKSYIEKAHLSKQTADDVYADRSNFMRGEIKRKNAVIAVLSVLLLICVLVIMAALIADALNDNIGYIWHSK